MPAFAETAEGFDRDLGGTHRSGHHVDLRLSKECLEPDPTGDPLPALDHAGQLDSGNG